MTMRRALGKVLDGLAHAFFALVRASARVTGWSFVWSAIVVFWIVLAATVLLMRFFHGAISLAIDAVFLVTILRVYKIVKKYDQAFNARDFAEVMRVREIIEGKGEPRSPALRALKKVGDGELLLQFEKWEEAADAFAAIAMDDLPALSRPGILTELGYARAHAGKVDKGVADVEKGLALADATKAYPKDKRWYLDRRHGIALSLAGEHERAVDVLEYVRADFKGGNREWAETYFFLGKSHEALGDTEAAVGALGCAVFGDGPFVARAWTTLEKIADPMQLEILRSEVAKERANKIRRATDD